MTWSPTPLGSRPARVRFPRPAIPLRRSSTPPRPSRPCWRKAAPSTPAPYALRWRRPSAPRTHWRLGLEGRLRGAEAAQVLFLRKFGRAMRARAGSRHGDARHADPVGERCCRRRPAAPRRAKRFQQFSTPIAARLRRRRRGGADAAPISFSNPRPARGCWRSSPNSPAPLALNEIADTRAGLLARLFATAPVTRHNAEQIHDRLDPAVRPSVVSDEPALLGVAACRGPVCRSRAFRHVASALARLAEGGRLVAITGRNARPRPARLARGVRAPAGARARRVHGGSRGQAYARHGTTMDTRLTVIDRVPAEDPQPVPGCPASPRTPPSCSTWSTASCRRAHRWPPPGPPLPGRRRQPRQQPARRQSADHAPALAPSTRASLARTRRRAVELAYETCDGAPGDAGASSARASTKATRCRPCASPAHTRIRPGSCSRPPWPRSRRRSRPTARTCRRASSATACCPTRSSKASSMPAKPMPAISPAS